MARSINNQRTAFGNTAITIDISAQLVFANPRTEFLGGNAAIQNRICIVVTNTQHNLVNG